MLKFVESFVEYIVFASRWLQAPIYLGLIFGVLLYCVKFLVQIAVLAMTVTSISEEELMLGVLGLVDMSMVVNLVYMVVVGGYTMFVSKIDIGGHPDRPEWLDSTNANTLKIKLASSLVGVSGIHLLKTFIELGQPLAQSEILINHVQWQVLIHLTFLGSSIALAFSEWLLHGRSGHGGHRAAAIGSVAHADQRHEPLIVDTPPLVLNDTSVAGPDSHTLARG